MNKFFKDARVELARVPKHISGVALGSLIILLPMLLGSPPSIAGEEVPVDPAIVLPPDPVWPALPATEVVMADIAATVSPMTDTLSASAPLAMPAESLPDPATQP